MDIHSVTYGGMKDSLLPAVALLSIFAVMTNNYANSKTEKLRVHLQLYEAMLLGRILAIRA
jgi:hypothetical protein